MEKLKNAYGYIKEMFEGLTWFEQLAVGVMSYFVAHLHTCTGIVVLLVMLFNLKLVYYKSKNEKIKYKQNGG